VDLCECRATAALCDRCVADGFAQLRGVAANRGHWGVDDVLARVRTRDPWIDGARARAWARRRVADLTRDGRLHELLAAEAGRAAAKRWALSLPGGCPTPPTDPVRSQTKPDDRATQPCAIKAKR
jgi:hypothetical protein